MSFSAPNQMLGYLYQIRYSLYLLLNAERDETELAIEKLDDITFYDEGTPTEILQLKHHINQKADLTNYSTDLWKTIRIWGELLLNGSFNDDIVLTLVTTSSVPDSDMSITRQLRATHARNNKHIRTELEKIANQSNNSQLKEAFDTYLKLSDVQKEKLVSSIQIIDNAPEIQDVEEKIKIKLLVLPNHRDAVYSRLEEWWFQRVVNHLRNSSSGSISRIELLHKLTDIKEQFQPDSLPIDYADAELPPGQDITKDQRQFVNQLRIIGLQNKQIEYAVRDYYRAFEQRSKWQREELLGLDELKKYENRLEEEWEREHLWRLSKFNETDDQSLKTFGSDLLHWAENSNFKIREKVTEPYVMRGSFHILANEESPRVWWHPKFVEMLMQKVDTATLNDNQFNTPHEIKNLFNIPFTSYLLYEAIRGYNTQKQSGMPFTLLFLVLPVILHKETRENMPRSLSTKFHNWLVSKPTVKIGFAERTRELVKYTRESVVFGMNNGFIDLIEGDKFMVTNKKFKSLRKNPKLDKKEVEDMKKKSFYIGRWYAKAGTISSIYVMWGIRP